MKDYKQLIKELPAKSVVFAFGRFNPPTIGHELLVKAVKKLAQQRNADHVIYASKTQDAKKNPLSVDKKVKYLKLMFKNTSFAAANDQERTFIEAAKALNKKYKNIVMVAGSDRVPEYTRLLNTYNGKEFNFDTIEVISAGERDPDADDATGMSASKMRNLAVKGNYAEFKKGLPSSVRDIDGKRLMNDVRDGMNLEPIKEQIILVKDELREKYFRGEIFNEGDIVESAGERFTIVKRGSNHLLLKEASGNLVSKWIKDVQPTEEKEDMNEALTDKTLRPNDKIKVARIIATMLGVDNAETSSNPENLINQALRKVRTKALNPEALHILDKMLNLATEQGIEYDGTLKPTKLKEAVTQPDGTDKIAVATDSPVVNTNSKYNMAKDILRFNDFKKLKKVQEQHKGKESQADHKKDNESDIDADFDSHETDRTEIGHTLVSPGGQDNLRRRKVKHHLGEAAADKAAKETAKANLMAKQAAEKEALATKQAREKEALSEAAPFKTKEDAVKYAKEKVKTHRDSLDGIEIHAHSGGFDVNHTMNASGRNSLQKIGAKHLGTIYKEEVEIKEAEYTGKGAGKPGWMLRADPKLALILKKRKQQQKHVLGTPSKEYLSRMHQANEELAEDNSHYDKAEQHKDDAASAKESGDTFSYHMHMADHHGSLADWHYSKGRNIAGDKHAEKAGDHEMTAHAIKQKLKEQTEEVCSVCDKEECECEKLQAGPVATDKPFDPFFKEDADELEFPEMSDDEIDKMADDMSDDDYLDAYDEDELGIVDAETGEELEADEEEEKKLKESTLMEVLSRIERMKARSRIRRTAAKRERATKIALKRYSNTATINKRARRLAIKLMKTRLLRGRDPSKISVGEKERIERTVEQRKAIIGRIATRLAPRVRKVEKARLSHTKYTQGSQPSVF